MIARLKNLNKYFWISIAIGFSMMILLWFTDIIKFPGFLLQGVFLIYLFANFWIIGAFRDNVKDFKQEIQIVDKELYLEITQKLALQIYCLFVTLDHKSFKKKYKSLLSFSYIYLKKEFPDEIKDTEEDKIKVKLYVEKQFYSYTRIMFREHLEAFEGKYDEGLTKDEIEQITSPYRALNKDIFHSALNGITGYMRNDELLVFKCDLITAFNVALEEREMKVSEFD